MIRKLYNACWYLVGGLLLLAAVTVTIIRLLLPGIDEYRQEIEDIASHYSGYPISIDSVSAEWQGWKPQLHLQGVTLHARDSQRPLAGFDSASINLAFFPSLWQQKPVPEALIISGARLKLTQTREGGIRFSDQRFGQSQAIDSNIEGQFGAWLLSQPLISLREAQLVWIDEKNQQQPLKLSNAALNLHRWHERFQIDGTADLPKHYGESLDFAIDVNGSLLEGNWAGDIYINATGIQPSAWPQYSRWQNLSVRAGSTDVRLWSQWNDARLAKIEGVVALQDTLIRGHGNSNLIRDLNANFAFQRDSENAWQLNARFNKLLTWNGNWPTTDIHLRGQKNDDSTQLKSAYISYLAIEDVLGLADLDTELANNDIGWLSDKRPHGELRQLHYTANNGDQSWQVSGRISNLGFHSLLGQPLLNGLTADFAMNNQRGRLQLNSDSLRLADPDIFTNPIDNIGISGQIDWFRDNDKALLLRTNKLQVDTRPHQLTLRGNLQFDDQAKPHADIVASISGGDIDLLKRFIPEIANPKLKQWLRNGILAGHVDNAGLVLRGDLADFPFKKQQGQFKLHAQLSDINMEYDPEWPPLYNINGEVIIDEDILSARVPSTEIYAAKLLDVIATIPDLYTKDNTLHIAGRAAGTTDDAIRFLENSPLKERAAIKRMLDLELAGPLEIALDMHITLFPGEDEISGEVRMIDNSIVSSNLGLTLEHITGYIAFSDDEITSRELKGVYYETPITMDITRPPEKSNAPIRMNMQGTADVAFLDKILEDKLANAQFNTSLLTSRLQGSTDWQVEILAAADDEQAELLRLTSGLHGMALDLPAPLGKTAAEQRNLQLQIELPRAHESFAGLSVDYGDILSARYADNGLGLSFGGETPQAISDSIIINGQTTTLNLDAWLALFNDYEDSTQTPITDQLTKLVDLDVQTDTLKIYSQTFNDTRLVLTNSNDNWLVQFHGTEISGNINLPSNLPGQPVSVDFQRLKLDEIEGAEQNKTDSGNLDPANFPALNIEVRDFIYGSTELGKFNLTADKAETGLNINRIAFNKPGMTIEGQGVWQTVNDEIFSQFDLDMQADRFTSMLSTFGYSDQAVEGGKTKIKIEALWPGSPMSFSLARLNGSLELEIQEGQFLDIDPKAGRLFGLLSIQTLPRRLSLDFNDLFKKGFAFDRIQGHFTFEEGNAYTNDLTMEGPAALITVTGRTGLVAQDYDQVITVIPQISDSLPLASALFGPVGIGVGAVIFLTGKVFESIPDQIDKLLGYQYRITGSWQDPVIEPLEKQQE